MDFLLSPSQQNAKPYLLKQLNVPGKRDFPSPSLRNCCKYSKRKYYYKSNKCRLQIILCYNKLRCASLKLGRL